MLIPIVAYPYSFSAKLLSLNDLEYAVYSISKFWMLIRYTRTRYGYRKAYPSNPLLSANINFEEELQSLKGEKGALYWGSEGMSLYDGLEPVVFLGKPYKVKRNQIIIWSKNKHLGGSEVFADHIQPDNKISTEGLTPYAYAAHSEHQPNTYGDIINGTIRRGHFDSLKREHHPYNGVVYSEAFIVRVDEIDMIMDLGIPRELSIAYLNEYHERTQINIKDMGLRSSTLRQLEGPSDGIPDHTFEIMSDALFVCYRKYLMFKNPEYAKVFGMDISQASDDILHMNVETAYKLSQENPVVTMTTMDDLHMMCNGRYSLAIPVTDNQKIMELYEDNKKLREELKEIRLLLDDAIMTINHVRLGYI